MGRAQAGSSLNEEAVASFAQAIALEPAASQPYIDMAASLLELGREGEAAAATARALEIAPLLPDTHLAAAHVAHTRGEVDAAIAACRRALEVAPDAARAYYLLSLWCEDFGRDGEIEAMDALYRADATAFEQKTLLAFALSNAFERLGDYGKAWAYLSEGNALKRRIWSEEVSGVADVAREVRSMDWHALAQTGRGQETGSESAVFILGLSRSGKTLTETLLSRHPLIEAGGELASLARLVQERLIGGTGAHFPACLNGREHLPLREIGEAYLSALKLGERAGPYVVNTSPGNWPYVGLILACLPRAKIIVCRREARDNCFEIFKTAYAIRNTYSYDLDATGRYHGLYTAMMDYWAQLFPDSMHFVQFEQLITDPQAEVLGILDFLGIDRSAAPVQALFSGDALAAALPRPEAVTGRWRPYSEFLQPLFDALDECEGGNASRAHEPLPS